MTHPGRGPDEESPGPAGEPLSEYDELFRPAVPGPAPKPVRRWPWSRAPKPAVAPAPQPAAAEPLRVVEVPRPARDAARPGKPARAAKPPRKPKLHRKDRAVAADGAPPAAPPTPSLQPASPIPAAPPEPAASAAPPQPEVEPAPPVALSGPAVAPEPAAKPAPVAAPAPASGPAPEAQPAAAPAVPTAATPEPAVPREEELPTGRPGPYFDPATELPVFTNEEIEAHGGTTPPRRRLIGSLVVLGAALAAFATGLVVFNNMIMPRFIHSTAEVKVPDLSSLNYDQAEQALRPLGLILSRAGERFDPSVPRGFVLSQDPPPDTPVRGRKRVMVVVSLGEEFSSVPSLFGESLRSARFLLQRSGLRVTGITRAPSEEVGEGLVSGTDPPAETVLPHNATVALLVSSGTGQEQYVMPELLGREIAGIRRQLESLGFRVITPPAAPSVGAIVYQDPPAGSRITLDSPISLQATGRVIR